MSSCKRKPSRNQHRHLRRRLRRNDRSPGGQVDEGSGPADPCLREDPDPPGDPPGGFSGRYRTGPEIFRKIFR